jgi:polar amino acid transport system substrate-binding protein
LGDKPNRQANVKRGNAMKKNFRGLFATVALLATVAGAEAQQTADPRVADVVRAGKIRIGLHLPQFVKDPVTGEIHGHGTGTVIVPIAQALAARLGVQLQLIGHPAPPALVECLKASLCDVGFLGVDPTRSADVDYTPPYIMVPFTYLVPAGSSIQSVVDVDKPGVRIAVVRNHVSTLALERILKHAELIGVDIPEAAFELVRTGKVDAYASPRPPILEYAEQLPGARVLGDRYGANLQGIAVAKDRVTRLAYVSAFVEEMKASGFVQQIIDRAGERGIQVAPAEDLTAGIRTKR